MAKVKLVQMICLQKIGDMQLQIFCHIAASLTLHASSCFHMVSGSGGRKGTSNKCHASDLRCVYLIELDRTRLFIHRALGVFLCIMLLMFGLCNHRQRCNTCSRRLRLWSNLESRKCFYLSDYANVSVGL